MSVELWTERYRPCTLDDYVWRDHAQRQRIEGWIAAGALPHLLFSGPPGTGKTSMARLLLRELAIPPADILAINASRERRIDEIERRWVDFVETWAEGPSGIKYVEFDEADAMSAAAQRMLRNDLETHADTCRVIFTCNYPNKIIPALHDRCQTEAFVALDRDAFIVRVGEILSKEAVAFDLETVTLYVDRAYPSLRKCINLVQDNIIGATLAAPRTQADDTDRDYLYEMVRLFRAQDYIAGRQLLLARATPEEYPDIYRYLYQHLDLFGATQAQQDDALLIIAAGVRHHGIVADTEINLAATLVELTSIAKPR